MVRLTDCPAMTIAVDLGRIATKQTNKTFTNSEDPGEMQHYAAFHLSLHCLQKFLLRGFPNTKG